MSDSENKATHAEVDIWALVQSGETYPPHLGMEERAELWQIDQLLRQGKSFAELEQALPHLSFLEVGHDRERVNGFEQLYGIDQQQEKGKTWGWLTLYGHTTFPHGWLYLRWEKSLPEVAAMMVSFIPREKQIAAPPGMMNLTIDSGTFANLRFEPAVTMPASFDEVGSATFTPKQTSSPPNLHRDGANLLLLRRASTTYPQLIHNLSTVDNKRF